MNRASVWLSLVWAIVVANPVCAQEIHVILIGDTESNLREGATENLRRMGEFFDTVKTDGNLSVRLTSISGKNFKCSIISKTVADLRVNQDDAVIFYYAGHGIRRKYTKTKFPEFDCQRSRNDRRLEMGSISREIKAKKPRFFAIIADACNVNIDIPAPGAAAPAPQGTTEGRRAAMRRLFLGYNGNVLMSGAVPNETAWYMTYGSALGGFFTNQLLDVLASEISSRGDEIQWSAIASKATQSIAVPNSWERLHVQRPQFESRDLRRTSIKASGLLP